MKSSFKNVKLTSTEIGQYIKKHGGLQGISEPCVYVPELKYNDYHYYEEESDDTNTIKYPLACGVNINDKKYLPDSVFLFVNDDSTNAISTKIGLTPIIGIYTGSIADIEYNANLMIGTIYEQEKFPYSLLKRKIVSIGDDGLLNITSKDALLGYKDERMVSYLVSQCALRFLVLHEIGHHVKGHISNLEKVNNFVLLKATDKVNSSFEHEADAFAASKIAEEYGLVLSELERHIMEFDVTDPNELALMALKIIVLATTLPYSILYQPESNITNEDNIESTIAYREMINVIILFCELYNNEKCKSAVIWDVCQQSINGLTTISEEIDINQIKKEKHISPTAFVAYLREDFIRFKQLYYKVNEISDKDFYLKSYIKVLSYLKN